MREKHTALGRESKRFIPVAVMVLAQGFLLPLPIDNTAHIGGFAGGFVVAYLSGARGHARGDDSLWKTVALVCIAVTVYAFFRMVQLLLAARL
jgi:membrane associated rhomboid family serine protease